MKKISSLLLSFLLIFNLLIFVPDVFGAGTVINLQIDNPVMTVNGSEKEIDPGMGTAPVVVGDRTLVPIRAIIENLGGNVGWDQKSKTATLQMGDDVIMLTVGDDTAYLNKAAYDLDVAPRIINDRTMLPVRFIAESFDFDVAWHPETRTVTILKNGETKSKYNFLLCDIPPYSGQPYVTFNNNVPFFVGSEISSVSYEYYSEMDYLGRSGACIASVSEDIMPEEERESIGSVSPTGWHSVKYDSVSGGYLYNRCHLIGYQISAENANRNNLITGTRYLNVEGMLPFENIVVDYVENSDNHVMYRATPVFEGENLLASGVLLEAYSVEDFGKGLSFCVYCYNVQPGITISYADGTSQGAGKVENTTQQSDVATENAVFFIINKNSKKFHIPSCSSAKRIKAENKEISYDTASVIIMNGFSPCGICKPQ